MVYIRRFVHMLYKQLIGSFFNTRDNYQASHEDDYAKELWEIQWT